MAKKPKPYTREELEKPKKDKEFADKFVEPGKRRRETLLPKRKKK